MHLFARGEPVGPTLERSTSRPPFLKKQNKKKKKKQKKTKTHLLAISQRVERDLTCIVLGIQCCTGCSGPLLFRSRGPGRPYTRYCAVVGVLATHDEFSSTGFSCSVDCVKSICSFCACCFARPEY